MLPWLVLHFLWIPSKWPIKITQVNLTIYFIPLWMNIFGVYRFLWSQMTSCLVEQERNVGRKGQFSWRVRGNWRSVLGIVYYWGYLIWHCLNELTSSKHKAPRWTGRHFPLVPQMKVLCPSFLFSLFQNAIFRKNLNLIHNSLRWDSKWIIRIKTVSSPLKISFVTVSELRFLQNCQASQTRWMRFARGNFQDLKSYLLVQCPPLTPSLPFFPWI